MLGEKAALGGASAAGGSDEGPPGVGAELGALVGALVGATVGAGAEGDGAFELGAGAGVGDFAGAGVGAGGADTGAGGVAVGGVAVGGVAVGGVAVGGVAVGGEAVGAAPGAWAMHEVAKRPKIIKTWNPWKPIFIFESVRNF